MGKGFSATAVACLCAVFFFVGCFIQQLPVLPDVSSGFSSKPSPKKAYSIRRRATELGSGKDGQEALQPQNVISPAASNNSLVDLPGAQARSYDEAVAHLLPPNLEPGDSGSPFHVVAPYQQVSWYPRLYIFPKFIDDERADHIVKIAQDRLGPSTLAYRINDDPKDSVDVRTSSGTFMTRNNDPDGVLAWVEEKIASVTHTPVAHGEPFNILRYNLGQHYDAHYDVFDSSEYGPQSTNRMATALFYLTDVEEGGETVFPFEGEHGMARKANFNYKQCDVGYVYKPRKGDAVVFYNMHSNGTKDDHSLHGGCPVKKGMKMVMTRWIRDGCHGRC